MGVFVNKGLPQNVWFITEYLGVPPWKPPFIVNQVGWLITPISMVYDTHRYSIYGGYEPIYNRHNCRALNPNDIPHPFVNIHSSY